jgi:DNA topoisomerase-1
MSKPYLVITESPGKIKKLQHILGSQYQIMASMGHVNDLPRKAFGIDVATMQPDYEIVKADVAKRLRAEAKKPYQTIYLAADPDRDGGDA